MKLKKFAAMMLAGVMAVSMLAGCSTGVKPEDPTEETVTGVNAASVIAALDADTTKNVTFSASSDLQKTLEDAIKKNNGAVTVVDVDDLKNIDDELNSTKLPIAANDDQMDQSELKEQNFTFIKTIGETLKNADDYTEKYIVNELAKAIDEATATQDKKAWIDLPMESDEYTSQDDGSKFTIDFKYTAEVAVSTATSINGDSIVYAVVSVTRTPTRVAAE